MVYEHIMKSKLPMIL